MTPDRSRFPVANSRQSIRILEEALAGLLEVEEAEALLHELLAHFPEYRKCRASGPQRMGPALVEKVLDEMIAGTVLAAPFEEARATVRHYGTRALFDSLLERSRREGRQDRRRGVDLARLAVESLDGCADTLDDAVYDLRALGWAWVGNAWRLVPDLRRAEEAFSQAGASWRAPREKKDSQIEAQIWDLKASLRLFQRRFRDAAELRH